MEKICKAGTSSQGQQTETTEEFRSSKRRSFRTACWGEHLDLRLRQSLDGEKMFHENIALHYESHKIKEVKICNYTDT